LHDLRENDSSFDEAKDRALYVEASEGALVEAAEGDESPLQVSLGSSVEVLALTLFN
jgi:hypothetical protein